MKPHTHSTVFSATISTLATLCNRVFPNGRVAGVCLVAIVAEAIMLARTPSTVYDEGWLTAIFAAAYLVTFWMTVGWLAYWLGGKWRSAVERRSRMGRLAVGSLLSLALCAVGLVYLVSWGLFLQTSRFGNLEAIHFLLANPRDLWLYITQAEPAHLCWLALFAVLLVGGVGPLLRWMAAPSSSGPAPTEIQIARTKLWFGLLAIVAGLLLVISHDESRQRAAMRLGSIKTRVNPLLSMVASTLDTWMTEPIEPCLDTSQLVSRSVPAVEPYLAVGVSSENGVPGAKTQQRLPSIIVVAIESMRNDVINMRHQGREVTPNVNRLAAGGLQFTKAYAESTHSDYADVCLVSSLYPLRTREHHYYEATDPWPKTLLYDVLKPAGYATAIISSQNEAWGGMDQFLDSPNLDRFYHPQRSDGAKTMVSERDLGISREIRVGNLFAGKFPDRYTTGVAIDWIKKQHEAGRPFYLGMNLQSSHFPYLMPEDTPRPFQPCKLDSDVYFMDYPEEKTPIVWNAYLNAIAECDRQIGRLVAALDDLGIRDEVILVVTGENGEAFHENGSVGHARHPVEPALRVACVINAPGYLAPRVESYPFEHVDLVPTLLGLAGRSPGPSTQGIDVLAKDRPPLAERLQFFHVLTPAARCDAVLLAGRWKYIFDHDAQQGRLFDVVNDPGETHDLADEKRELAERLHDVLLRWRRQQLAYYHYPMYYESYYPPRPPRWNAQSAPDSRAGLAQHVQEAATAP